MKRIACYAAYIIIANLNIEQRREVDGGYADTVFNFCRI